MGRTGRTGGWTGRTLRLRSRILCLFDGKTDLAILGDVQDTHLDGISLVDVVRNLLHIGGRNLRDMNHAGFSFAKIYKGAKLGDASDLSFANLSYFELHIIFSGLLKNDAYWLPEAL